MGKSDAATLGRALRYLLTGLGKQLLGANQEERPDLFCCTRTAGGPGFQRLNLTDPPQTRSPKAKIYLKKHNFRNILLAQADVLLAPALGPNTANSDFSRPLAQYSCGLGFRVSATS